MVGSRFGSQCPPLRICHTTQGEGASQWAHSPSSGQALCTLSGRGTRGVAVSSQGFSLGSELDTGQLRFSDRCPLLHSWVSQPGARCFPMAGPCFPPSPLLLPPHSPVLVSYPMRRVGFTDGKEVTPDKNHIGTLKYTGPQQCVRKEEMGKNTHCRCHPTQTAVHMHPQTLSRPQTQMQHRQAHKLRHARARRDRPCRQHLDTWSLGLPPELYSGDLCW